MVAYGVKNEVNIHKSIPITKDFENSLSSFYLEVTFRSCSTKIGVLQSQSNHRNVLKMLAEYSNTREKVRF